MQATKSAHRNVCYITWNGYASLAAALEAGDALLTVHNGNCTNYTVRRLTDQDGETIGYQLTKLTDYIVDRKVYDIEVTGNGMRCNCPDATFKRHECKHVRALRAALTRHGLI